MGDLLVFREGAAAAPRAPRYFPEGREFWKLRDP